MSLVLVSVCAKNNLCKVALERPLLMHSCSTAAMASQPPMATDTVLEGQRNGGKIRLLVTGCVIASAEAQVAVAEGNIHGDKGSNGGEATMEANVCRDEGNVGREVTVEAKVQ